MKRVISLGGFALAAATMLGGGCYPQDDATRPPVTTTQNSQLSVTPAAADYGQIKVGEASREQAFVIKNEGKAVTPALQITGLGPEFTETFNDCKNATLAPGASCTVSVVFKPAQEGSRSASISLSAGAMSASFSTRGTGMKASDGMPSAATIKTSLDTFEFAKVTKQGSSDPKIFMVTNTGTVASGKLDVKVSGATDNFKIVDNTCTAALEPRQGSCYFAVTFTPTTPFKLQWDGAIDIIATPGGTQHITLKGTADQAVVGKALLTADPTQKRFDQTKVGFASATQTFTIKNVGEAPSGAFTVTKTTNAFSLNNSCVNSLNKNETCTVAVNFVPGQAQAYADILTVASASGSSVNINLSGTGYTDQGNQGGGTTTTGTGQALFQVYNSTTGGYDTADGYSFATQPSPGGSVSVTGYYLTNTSTTDTMTVPKTWVGRSPYPADSGTQFAVGGNCAGITSLPPNTYCSFDIVFQPTKAGTFGARLYAGSNQASVYAVGTSQ